MSEENTIKLRNIENYMSRLLVVTEEHHRREHNPSTYRGQNTQGWTYEQSGKSWFYEQQVTFTGSSQNINLDFPKAVDVKMIEQVFNDGTSKDFIIRKSASPSLSTFSQLSTQVGHTSISEVDYDVADMPQLSRLQFNYSNTTNGKTVLIRVTVKELS